MHKLRDRLPMPARGAPRRPACRCWFAGLLRPVRARSLSERKSRNGFIAEVAEELSDGRPVNAEQAIRCVFGILTRHVSEGQIRKVCDALPHGLRQLWPTIEELRLAENCAPGTPQAGRCPSIRRKADDRHDREEPLVLTEAQQV
jgi:uncharacterized protein (DUF2267 family)